MTLCVTVFLYLRTMKDQLAIYPDRSALSGGFLFSALFTVVAAIMLALFWEDMMWFVALVFGAVLLLFAFLTFTTGRALARNRSNPQPQLLLDASGITFCDNDGTRHPVAWCKVIGFQEVTIARQPFILIGVQNPQALIDAEPSVKHRKLMTHNLNHYGTPFVLAPTLKYPQQELLPTLQQFHARYRTHGAV